MKKWLMMVAALAISVGAFAAEGWMTDFEKAKSVAKEEGKYMLMDFSGSDWCGWCIKLDKEVFQKPAFKKYAADNLVLMLVDFPKDKSNQSEEVIKQNEKLSKEFSVRGFPTVYVLTPDGRVIGNTGYEKGGAEAYVELLKSIIAESKAKK
ncbi:thioredoxin family protein [Pontiellaceae bacterium B12219]|nr:thioredoxin family protein [Pontiellaceae bacterium B12219]